MCKICGKKELARGLCNACYKASRYISHKEEFPLKVGFSPSYRMLNHQESRAIDACAKKRGIRGVGNISRYTEVGGIRFQ